MWLVIIFFLLNLNKFKTKSMTSLFKKKGSSCCVAFGCSMRKGTNLLSEVRMFNFPTDPERRKRWKIAVNRANWSPTKYSQLCNLHFITVNPERRKRWELAVRRANWSASKNSQLCNLHFITGRPSADPLHPDYVPSVFCFKKPNLSSTTRYERHASRLKTSVSHSEGRNVIESKKRLSTLNSDTVPVKCLKPSYSVTGNSSEKHSQNSIKNLTDKTSLALNSCDSGNATNSEDGIYGDLPVHSVKGQISDKKKCLPYNELIKNIQLVKKPSKSWSVVCTDKFTIFARWNDKFIAERRLVIESSLNVRVFLQDWEMEMTDLVDLTSVDDVTALLEKVENYNMDTTC